MLRRFRCNRGPIFQSGSRVLKKVSWTFSYLYLRHIMWFHAENWLKTLKFWKSLISLYNLGSRPQKAPKTAQKTDHSIAICSNFCIDMAFIGWYLMNPHVQTVQNKYGKGGYRLCTTGSLRPSYGRPKLILISRRSKSTLSGVRNNLSAKIVKIQPSHGISGILIHMNYR